MERALCACTRNVKGRSFGLSPSTIRSGLLRLWNEYFIAAVGGRQYERESPVVEVL